MPGTEAEWDERIGRPDDDIDVQLVMRDGVAGFMPVGLKHKLDDEGFALVLELQGAVRTISEARQQMTETVGILREKGVSWDSIGWCVGTTGRAAAMRWGS